MKKYIIYQIGFVVLASYYGRIYAEQKKCNNKPKFSTEFKQEIPRKSLSFKNDNLSYYEKLERTKKMYPFEKWRKNFIEFEMEQYTEENCNRAKAIFDTLIKKLQQLGEHGKIQAKEKCFKTAILDLNKLNQTIAGLIETGEREDLCELIDQITIASGLKPQDYADGEGIADLWRDW